MFFRAGVLGQMEELRDDRLSKIIGWLQSYIRGYIARKEFKKLQDQRLVNERLKLIAEKKLEGYFKNNIFQTF